MKVSLGCSLLPSVSYSSVVVFLVLQVTPVSSCSQILTVLPTDHSLASWFTRSTCSKRPPLLLCLLPLFTYRFKSNQILDSDHQSVHYCFNNKTLKTFLPSLCPLSGTGLNWYHTVTTSNNKVHLKSNYLQNSPEVRNIFLKHYHNL